MRIPTVILPVVTFLLCCLVPGSHGVSRRCQDTWASPGVGACPSGTAARRALPVPRLGCPCCKPGIWATPAPLEHPSPAGIAVCPARLRACPHKVLFLWLIHPCSRLVDAPALERGEKSLRCNRIHCRQGPEVPRGLSLVSSQPGTAHLQLQPSTCQHSWSFLLQAGRCG